MGIEEKEILHKGLRRLWVSGGVDTSGLSPGWANTLRAALVHLDTARNFADIEQGYGKQKHVKRLTGQINRYSMEINGNWRLTFTCDDHSIGTPTKIDIEDLHRKGGAKKR